MSQYRWCHP